MVNFASSELKRMSFTYKYDCSIVSVAIIKKSGANIIFSYAFSPKKWALMQRLTMMRAASGNGERCVNAHFLGEKRNLKLSLHHSFYDCDTYNGAIIFVSEAHSL